MNMPHENSQNFAEWISYPMKDQESSHIVTHMKSIAYADYILSKLLVKVGYTM